MRIISAWMVCTAAIAGIVILLTFVVILASPDDGGGGRIGSRGAAAYFGCFLVLYGAPLAAIPCACVWAWVCNWRPAKPGPYCLSCGYDLTGCTAGVCSECGMPARILGDSLLPRYSVPQKAATLLTVAYAITSFVYVIDVCPRMFSQQYALANMRTDYSGFWVVICSPVFWVIGEVARASVPRVAGRIGMALAAVWILCMIVTFSRF